MNAVPVVAVVVVALVDRGIIDHAPSKSQFQLPSMTRALCVAEENPEMNPRWKKHKSLQCEDVA